MINLIIDILKADANITAITTTDRIYPVSRLEGGVIPAIVVQLTNTDPADTHDNTTNMDAHTVQVSVIEDRPKEAHALAELCRAALDGYSGGTIAECRFVNQATDVFESIDLYTQTMLFRVMLVRDNVTLPTALADLGIFELDDVSDVNLDEPLDREALVYDEATQTWINGGPAKIDFPVTNNYAPGFTVGQVVGFNGEAQGDRPRIELFSASSSSDPRSLVGVCVENMNFRQAGHVRSYGTVYGVNTNDYPVGTILYASTTAGELTATPPTAPNHRIALAVVTRQHQNTGRIFVRTYTPAYRLADLSNVASTSPTTGQGLVWNGTAWAPGSVGYTPGSPPPGGFLGNVFYQDNAGNLTFEDEFRYTASTNTLAVENITGTTVTGSGVVKGSNTFGQRYATQAATNRALADTASLTVERYFTVTAEGNGESFNIQSNSPSAGNKIVRKIWYKDEAFEDTDVNTWTLLHTFAADTAYASTATKWQEYLDGQTYGKPPFTLAISWEQQPLALLDSYSTNMAYGYALVPLISSYAGSAVRVRRASDNTEQDIGFNGLALDTASLTSFCTGTNGFVKTWYDQSGNARNATQTTTSNQPKIYDSSTGVVLSGGLPAIEFNGANSQRLAVSASISPGTPHFWGVHEFNGGIVYFFVAINSDNTFGADNSTSLTFRQQGSTFTTATTASRTRKSWNWLNDGANTKAAVNNDAYTTATQTKADALQPRIGSNGSQAGFFTGKIQAIVGYNADKTSDRAAIDTALNNFYSIY